MSDFLLEIYGEEIPSSTQSLIENQFEELFKTLFSNFEINFSDIQTFSTSRRVTIFVKELSKSTKSQKIEIRGPQINANEKAIKGFLKSNNLNNIKLLEKKEINSKVYYFFKKNIKGKKVFDLLKLEVPKILRSIKWKKSMRWGEKNDRWIRPIKNILCLFDKKIIKFEFAGYISNNFTYGNYHYSEKKIKCEDFLSYKKKLKENYVILERSLRQNEIVKKVKTFCKKNKLNYFITPSFLKRVSDAVEHPNIFFGKFSTDFFKLPEFLLTNIMTDKQDYFFFKDQKNKLSDRFGFVAGINPNEKDNLIIGNQNVLRARFSDASFFIDEDKKNKLSERHTSLNEIIFYEQTGSLFDRAIRINSLVKFIYKRFGTEKNDKMFHYLLFSNADLGTELVKEFPNLQGKVGGYLAMLEDFPKNICDAFSDQYEYEFPDSYSNFLTFILSISQKFDSILGYFASKDRISGAGDPFGIRRSTLSIIKICIEKKIRINFYNLFSLNNELYKKQNIFLKIDYSYLFKFFKKRISILLGEMGFRQDLINASINTEFDPYFIFVRLKNMDKLYKSKDGNNFLKAFKRLNSLSEDMKQNTLNTTLFNKDEEKRLYELLNDLKSNIKKNYDFIFQNSEYQKKLSKTLDNFFDNVVVNDENNKIKINRKILIYQFRKVLNKEYRFSLLEIK